MTTVLDRVRKRRHYPVPEIGEGVFVRSLTRGELRRLSALETDLKDEFMFGCALTDGTGKPEFVQVQEETDVAFAQRVRAAIEEHVDLETRSQLGSAIARIVQSPSQRDLQKN